MLRRNKKIIIIVVVLAALVALGGWYLAEKRDNKLEEEAKISNTEGQLDRENRMAQREKEERDNNSQSRGSSAPKKVAAHPILSRWGVVDNAVEAAGFVQGVYEEGGTCTFRLTSGPTTVTRTSTSVKDATVTSCPPVQVPTSELAASKNWDIDLVYDSSAASGTSNKQSLTL